MNMQLNIIVASLHLSLHDAVTLFSEEKEMH
jgi:hypothetical protein